MFKTRIRKIIGDVLSRKGRTFLVSAAIFIGVLGTIALFSLSDIIVGQLREDLKEDELSMYDVFVTVNADTTLDDQSYLTQIGDVEGVTDVMGFIQAVGYFNLNADDPEDFEQITINSYTPPFEPRLPITPMRLIDGTYPVDGANELAIEQRMAEKFNLSIGDEIPVRILSESRDETLNGAIATMETWTVTGIVFHPYSFAPAASAYTSVADGKYITGSTGLTGFSARFIDFATAEAQADAVSEVIANDTPYIPVFSQVQDPQQNQLIQSAQTLAGTMSFLALIALIVSGFLVVNVISSIVVEQKRQIGVMKSIGATRWDNFFMYCGIAFAYGLIAVIPAVPLGIWAGNAASHALAPTLNTVLDGFQISIGSVIAGVLVGLLIPVLAAIIPVYFGTRVKILDAMTDLGIDANYGSGPIARFISILPVPITIRQGFSNVSLKKSRLIFTVITLSIAAGAFMGIFSVFSSLTSGINVFLDTFNVEIAVSPVEGREPSEIIGIIHDNYQTDDNNLIGAIEAGVNLQVQFEGYDPPPTTGGPPGILVYGYDVNSETPAFSFTVDEGEPLTEENSDTGIIFSSLLASNMGKGVGDSVILKVPGKSVELTIVGISEFPIEQVWMDWRTIATIAGYTLGAPKPNEYFTHVNIGGFESSDPDGVTVLGLNTQFASFIPFAEGEFFTPGEPGIILNSGLAENGGFEVGDELEVTAANGNSITVPVTGIFDLPPQFDNENIPSDFAGMYWEDLANLEGLSLDGEPLPQGYFLISTYDNPTIDQLNDLLDDINNTMLDNGIPVNTFNFVELTNQISQAFVTIQVVLQMVAALIALVGALGLLTTLSMSVFERQKEIGVMRSIGASSSTVVSQFLTEGLVVGLISWLIGIPIGVVIMLALLTVTGFIETFPPSFPVSAVVFGFVGIMVITMIASIWPSLSAARRTVSDILRYQ